MEECESDIVIVEWGLGSRPGSSDLLEWTEAGSGVTVEGGGLMDGQLVFLSLRVSTIC